MLETYLEILEEGYYEAKFAFEGLADENVWKRPAEGILSMGELAGHVAYWEGVRFAGEGGEPKPDPAKCRIKSPLIDVRFSYYPTTIATPPSEEHLSMSAAQVCDDFVRVHNEAIANLKTLNPDLDSSPLGFDPYYTYRVMLKYAIFHVDYHTGQMYTVRHLLGDQPTDN